MILMISILGCSAALALAALLVHYEALRGISCLLPRLAIPPRLKIVVALSAALVGHFGEIAMYAAGFSAFLEGNVEGQGLESIVVQAVYLSIESYASLGTSTGFPIGPLRLLAGTEALVGLILIGWTASYTYLIMQQLWGAH